MANGAKNEWGRRVRTHLFGWMLGALLVFFVEWVFCFFSFDILPISERITALLAYMGVGILLGILTSIMPYSSMIGRSPEGEHVSFSLVTATLVFFFAVIIITKTGYLLDHIGQGIGLLAVSLFAAAGAFVFMAWMSRKAGKALPFFISSIIVLTLVFLLLRYVNQYRYDVIFYQPPAIYFNIALVTLFFPLLYLLYKFFTVESVEKLVTVFRRKAGIPGLLIVTLLLFFYGRVASHLTAGRTGTPNIILIVMDTTRSDHLSCYGHELKTTPNIDAVASEGALFRNAIATGPWTVPTHCSMFTGLYPSSHGAHWEHMYLDSSLNTAAELLRDNGYQTVGFSNNGVVSCATNMSQGFEHFFEMWKSTNVSPLIYSLVKDVIVNVRGRKDAGARLTSLLIKGWFENEYDSEKPFFMFINYLEAHLLYNPPVNFQRRFVQDSDVVERMRKVSIRTLYKFLVDKEEGGFNLSGEDIEVLGKLYDAEIAYLDARIGELLDYLRAPGILDNTFLVITSDHGENIGDHDLIDHQLCLYDTLLHVPLILYYPPLIAGGIQVDAIVQSVDILPTLLAVAGVSAEDIGYPLQGKSLLDVMAGGTAHNYAYSEYMSPKNQFGRVQRWGVATETGTDLSRFDRRLKSIRSDTLKYIWASDGDDELFELSSDPNEALDVVESDTLSLEIMRKLLEDWQSSLPALVEGGAEIPEMDQETRDVLKALGYIE